MNRSNEPITPKANHRVIDGEVSPRHQQSSKTDSSDKSRQNKEPLKPKFSFWNWFPARVFRNLGWTFLIAVVGLLGYLTWSNNQSDWQIEHINTLQAQVAQVKSDVQALKEQQSKLAEKAQTSAMAGLTNAQQTKIESISLLESKLEILQSQVTDLQAKLSPSSSKPSNVSSATNTPSQTVVPATTSSDKVQSNAEQMDKLAQLDTMIGLVKQQLSEVVVNQQALTVENQAAKNSLAGQAKILDSLKAGANQTPDVLSATQIQHWALQINTNWLLLGDVSQTLQNLNNLSKAVSASDLTEKSTILTDIASDLAMLENQNAQPSDEAAKQSIEKLRQWVIDLKLTDKATTEVSHETTEADTTTIWQKIEQKLLSLFSIKKREDASELTQVEKWAQQDVFKQRALLLLDRLDWAFSSESQSQVVSSREALKTLVSSQMPQQMDVFMSLFQPVLQWSFKPRASLKLVEG